MFPPVTFRLEVVDEVSSTQEPLLAKRGTLDFHGKALLALRQTAGVGRRGRSWESMDGNLFLSFGLCLTNEEALPLLTFASGLALYAAASDYLAEGADLRLKWPNDLYLSGRKLAGMIAQGRTTPGVGSEVVVGVGVNLMHAPEGAIALGASTPQEFAELFLSALEAVFLEAEDFHSLREAWEKAARIHEDKLSIVGEEGLVTPEALLSTGELLVRCENGTKRKLSSEEVSVRFDIASAP